MKTLKITAPASSHALPLHDPMKCNKKLPMFRPGQFVQLASNYGLFFAQGLEAGRAYEVLAAQTHGYPSGQSTDLVVLDGFGQELLVKNAQGLLAVKGGAQ